MFDIALRHEYTPIRTSQGTEIYVNTPHNTPYISASVYNERRNNLTTQVETQDAIEIKTGVKEILSTYILYKNTHNTIADL
jgi:hypothetical protein